MTKSHLRLVASEDAAATECTPSAVGLPAATVILCGAADENSWLTDVLRSRGYETRRRDSLIEAVEDLAESLTVAAIIAPDQESHHEVLREILLVSPRLLSRVLLVTPNLTWSALRAFTDAGIRDFIKQPASASELVLRLDRCTSGAEAVDTTGLGIPFSPSVGTSVRLSDREALLYALLRERAGRPVRRDEILERVWGRGWSTSSNVVEVYISYLRAKLQRIAPGIEIETIRHVGYLLRPRRPEHE